MWTRWSNAADVDFDGGEQSSSITTDSHRMFRFPAESVMFAVGYERMRKYCSV